MATPWKEMYLGKGYPLREAAANGQLHEVRCNLCRRTVQCVVADLMKVLDPELRARLFATRTARRAARTELS